MPKLSNIFMVEMPEQPIIKISGIMPLNKIADFIAKSYPRLDSYMEECGERLTTDIPFFAYRDWRKMFNDDIGVSVTYPTVRQLPAKGDIESEVLPITKFIACYYQGRYKDMGETYAEMEKWAVDHSIEITYDSYEFHYDIKNYDEEYLLTKIYFPVKG